MDNIKIGYELDDGGSTDKKTKATAKLRDGLDEVTAAATRAGSATTKAMAASAAPKTSTAINKASMSTADKIDQYDQARAGVGTGAAGRDFAKQAQGLGGLVHVYATFAANLFAVTAAFTALKDAANTENMIRGLDSLSASSGKNLGSLAKQIAATTDGALSLRDAMTAVAQASSAGLGNKQINDIAIVAGKASQALGISMTDAVSRLSRGISKIEPELLDELGIFVKVNDATEKYALSVGKTASSLTDFEKRQAFANAVLEQGKQKFAAIEIQANPYDKLTASISNLATAGLTLVNKVLEPIVQLLANSPLALGLAFAYIASVLIKQAIPAIGAWREELTKSAEKAAKSAKDSYEVFRDYSLSKQLAEEAKLVGPINKQINDNIAGAQTQLAKTLSSKSKILAQAMSGTVDSASMNKMVGTEIARRQTILDKIKETAKTEKDASDAKKAAYAETIALQQKEIAQLEIAQTLYKNNKALVESRSKIENNTDRKISIEERLKKANSDAKTNSAISKGVLAQAGTDTQTKGTSAAFTELFANVKHGLPVFDEAGEKLGHTGEGLKGMAAAGALARGSILILGEAIGSVLGFLSRFMGYIGIIIGAYELLRTVIPGAAKEQENFTQKTDDATNAIKGANATLDLYAKKNISAFSVQGIGAYSTALSELSNAFDSQLTAFKEWQKQANKLDEVADIIKGLFGFSNTDKLKEAAAGTVKDVVKLLKYSSNETEGRQNIAKILGIDDPRLLTNTDALTAAMKKLSETDLNNLNKQIQQIEESEKKSNVAIQAFAENLKTIDKLVDQVIQGNAFNDLQAKIGVELVNASSNLALALQDPKKALASLAAMGNDPKFRSIFGPDVLASLNQASVKFAAITDATNKQKDAVTALKTATAEYAKELSLKGRGLSTQEKVDVEKKKLDDAATSAFRITKNLGELKAEVIKFAKAQGDLVGKLADEGFRRIKIGLKLAQEQAQNTTLSFNVGVAKAAGLSVADEEYKLAKADIDIQKRIIEANYLMQKATQENTEALNKLTAQYELSRGKADLSVAKTDAQKTAADEIIKGAEKTLNIYSAKAVLSNSVKGQQISYKDRRDLQIKTKGPEAVEGAERLMKNEDIFKLERSYALIGLDQKAITAETQRQISKTKELYDLQQKQNKATLDNLASQEGIVNLSKSLSDIKNIDLINSATELSLNKNQLETQMSRKEIQKQLLDNEFAYNNATDAAKKTYADSYKINKSILVDREHQLNIAEILKNTEIKNQSIREKSLAREEEITRQAQLRIEAESHINDLITARISLEKVQLNALVQLGKIDEDSATRKQAALDKETAALEYQTKQKAIQDQIDLKSEAYMRSLEVLQNAKDAKTKISSEQKRYEDQKAGLGGNSPVFGDLGTQGNPLWVKMVNGPMGAPTMGATNGSVLGAIGASSAPASGAIAQGLAADADKANVNLQAAEAAVALAEKQKNLAEESLDVSKKVYESKLKEIKAAAELSIELKKQKDHAEDLARVNEGLIAVFGDQGKQAADYITQLDKVSINEQKRTEQLKNFVGTDADWVKLKKKQTREELSDIANVAGATKGFFKEKTLAYKVFSAIEKAAHIVNIAMSAQRIVQQSLETGGLLANISARISATVAAAQVDGTAGVIKSVASIPFPANIAAGAAVAVIMAGLLSQIGGSGPGYTNAAVNTGTGTVTGNMSAPSESLSKSIEVLAPADPILMKNSSQMVHYLRSINDNIGNFGLALAKAGGLEASSMGVKTGFNTTSESNFLLWGADFIRGIGGVLGLGSIMDSISKKLGFGSSQEITGQGITAGPQSIGNIKKNGFGGSFYTNVHKEDKALGISYNSSDETRYQGIGAELSKTISNIFSSIGSAIVSSAGALGKDANKMIEQVNSFVVNFGSLSFSGQDPSKVLENIVGQQMDLLVASVYPELVAFNKIGEGMGQTLSRVVYGIESATVALESIGIQAIKYTDIINKQGVVDAEIVRQSVLANETQSLIQEVIKNADGSGKDLVELYTKLDTLRDSIVDLGISQEFLNSKVLIAAGGTDKFSEGLGKFFDKFTTEAFKTSLQIGKAQAAFTNLGIAVPDTREKFHDLFVTLSTSSPEAAAGLLKVIDSIDAMYTNTEQILEKQKAAWESFFGTFASASQKSFIDTLKVVTVFNKFNQEIPKTKSELLTLVDRLRASAPDTADAIMAISSSLNTYYSSADSFESVTLSLSNSLKTATDTLKSQIKTLKDYNSSLLIGSQSTLTSTQQYSVAKDEVSRLKGIIGITPKTAEEEKARAEALASLPKAADAFLKLSSTLYASGAQYSSDYTSIQSYIASLSGVLETQLSDTEKQLNSLTTSNGFLEDISKSTKSTAELMSIYLAQGGTPTTTNFASNSNYVPNAAIDEGVDRSPRPYLYDIVLSGNQVNNKELLAEVCRLTKQVEELAAAVADGAILNAKATDRNTEQLTQVISTSSDKTIQANRLQTKATIK